MEQVLVDVLDRGTDLVVQVALAGVLEPDVDITLGGGFLFIRADRPASSGRTLVREIPRGLLARRVELPYPAELREASFEEGLLTLVLTPRRENP